MQKIYLLSQISKRYFPKKLSVARPYFLTHPDLPQPTLNSLGKGKEVEYLSHPKFEGLSHCCQIFVSYYKSHSVNNLFDLLHLLSELSYKDPGAWELHQSLLGLTYLELAIHLPIDKQRKYLILSKDIFEGMSKKETKNNEWVIQHLILSNVALNQRKKVANLIKIYYPYRTHLINLPNFLEDLNNDEQGLALPIHKQRIA